MKNLLIVDSQLLKLFRHGALFLSPLILLSCSSNRSQTSANFVDLTTLPEHAAIQQKAASRFTAAEITQRTAVMLNRANTLKRQGKRLWEEAFSVPPPSHLR